MTGNIGKDDVFLHLDSRFRDTGSIQNARFNIEKIANVKAVSVENLQFFNVQYTVDDRNRKVYINDGSDKTITLDKGRYDGDSIATELQSKLNSSSSGFTVTFSDKTLKMTISRTSSYVLKTGTTTDSAWTVLGFDTDADKSSSTSNTSDNIVKLASKYYYITSNIVQSTHINKDLRDNILILFSNTQNFGNLITRPAPQIIPASSSTIDLIKLKLFDDEDNLVDCNNIGYSLTLRFHR